ncbi:Zinc finger CCCH domain-containing protein 5 [Capsicum chinense]|nr:Zinc finger CCCH domain-containing protein 5 [Capsicum chinense]
MCSRTQPMDTAPLTEVTSPGAETRLEEPILQLSVGVGGGNGSGSELYPERPNAPDCGYYWRNGFCGYGARCRFNHPRNRSLVMEALRATIGEHPERFGQAVCQEPFLFPTAIPPPTTYPALQSPSIHSTEQYGMVFGNWPVLRPTLLSGSYLRGTYGPTLSPPEMVPMPDWTSYLAFASPVASQSIQSAGVGPVYGPMQLSASILVGPCMSLTASPSASINIQKEFAFLNRPGQPECRYCVKFGECKYGSSCKYHHQRDGLGSAVSLLTVVCQGRGFETPLQRSWGEGA